MANSFDIPAYLLNPWFNTGEKVSLENLLSYFKDEEVTTLREYLEDLITDAASFTQDGDGAVTHTMQDKARESVSILDFMSEDKVADVVARTGLYDHSPEILVAANYAVANNKTLRAPAGLYMWGGTRIAPTLSADSSFVLHGDGSSVTEFREIDGTTGASVGHTVLMFYFNSASLATQKLEIRGITVNHRGSESLVDVDGDYLLEQSHCISVNAGSGGTIERVLLDDVITKDKIGGGIVLAGGRIKCVEINNCHGVDYLHNGGQRGDLEFQSSVDLLTVTGCTGEYVQCEPNATTPTSGILPLAIFAGCKYEAVDFAGYDDAETSQTIVFNDSIAARSSQISNLVIKADRSSFLVTATKQWRTTGPGSVLTDCEIITEYDANTDVTSPLNPLYVTAHGGNYLKFIRCRFYPEEGASATTTGYAVSNSASWDGANPYQLEFEDCEFSSFYQYNLNAYRNGNYVLRRCKLTGRDWAIQFGSSGTDVGTLVLDNNDLSGVGTSLLRTLSAVATSSLTFNGAHDYSKFTISVNTGPFSNLETNFKPLGHFYSSSAPAGAGIKGMRVRITQPTVGNPAEYVCTTSSSTAGTWVPVMRVELSGSKTQDWADLATATQQSTTVTVTGAALGDFAEASMSVDLAGTSLRAYVSAADTVTVYHRNDTGANVNLASGTLRARVRKA